MKPPPVRLLSSRQLSRPSAAICSPQQQLFTSTTVLFLRPSPSSPVSNRASQRHASTYTPPASSGYGQHTSADNLRRRYRPRPEETTAAQAAEKARIMTRIRYSALGLLLCAAGMGVAVYYSDIPPEGSNKTKSELINTTHNDGPALPDSAPSGVTEQSELVATGTSSIPFFPRTIHLNDGGAAAGTQPTPTLPAGTATPPPSPGSPTATPLITDTNTPASPDAAGTEYQLLGLGIRTVSILSIQVYVVGLYVASSDIAKLQERLIRTIDPVATTLVAGEMDKLRQVLLDPVKSEEIWNTILTDGQIRTAWRIVPVRNTDFMHMRDGFVRGITARTPPMLANASEAEQASFGSAMNEFKAVFGGGSRKKIPYGSVLYLLRDSEGVFEAVYEDKKSGVREVMGTVQDERVGRLLWLNYLGGANVSSEDARKSVVRGAVEWTSRPVGTVAAQVV